MRIHAEEVRHALRLEVPGVEEAKLLMATALMLHGPVDVTVTLMHPHLESNPIVHGLGFEMWVLLKIGLLPALMVAYLISHEHPITRLMTLLLVALGVVLILPNIAVVLLL